MLSSDALLVSDKFQNWRIWLQLLFSPYNALYFFVRPGIQLCISDNI